MSKKTLSTVVLGAILTGIILKLARGIQRSSDCWNAQLMKVAKFNKNLEARVRAQLSHSQLERREHLNELDGFPTDAIVET